MYGVDELNAFLDGLPNLDSGVLIGLSIRPTDDEARALAHARLRARRVAAVSGLDEALESVRGQIVTWSSASGVRSVFAADEVLIGELRLGAAQAIVDAATAILMADALDNHTHEVLVERWESVRELRLAPEARTALLGAGPAENAGPGPSDRVSGAKPQRVV